MYILYIIHMRCGSFQRVLHVHVCIGFNGVIHSVHLEEWIHSVHLKGWIHSVHLKGWIHSVNLKGYTVCIWSKHEF